MYILRCADGTLYTGITTDTIKRVTAHNEAKTGARYTRARRPVTLVYQAEFPDKSTASREEARIKKLSRDQKEDLLYSNQ